MTYRDDIDGLRAIAVLLVILSHLGFEPIAGGFIGVDVFFVISGFLITGIIHERLRSGSFSYAWFYTRRMKRLMPVLFFILAATTIAFSFVLLPRDMERYAWSVVFVVFNLGNFYFWREHGGYFGGDAQEAPLLHAWSLAVEEQYYLIWPFMLFLTVRLIPGRWIPYIFAGAFVVSIWFSQWGTEVTIGAAYYMLPTRFFELLAGSWLALAWSKLPKLGTLSTNALATAGMGLVLATSTTLNETSSFPGYNAAYPVIGTVLLIATPRSWIARILSARPFVFTGKISYSMYLWHWPLIVWFVYTERILGWPEKVLCIFLTYILSFVTWRYVEEPFRRSSNTDFKSVATRLYVLPAVLLISVSLAIVAYEGFPHRFDPDLVAMHEATFEHPDKLSGNCHAALRQSGSSPSLGCELSNLKFDAEGRVLLIGDSHANHFLPFVGVLAKDARLATINYTMDQCPPIRGLYWGQSDFKAARCYERNEQAYAFIEKNKFEFVVLAAWWSGRDSVAGSATTKDGEQSDRSKTYFDYVAASIDRILQTGATPVIIEGMSGTGALPPACPVKRKLFGRPTRCAVADRPNRFFSETTDNLKNLYPSLIVIRPRELVCASGSCRLELDGNALYRDSTHLNAVGSETLAQAYIEEHGNPFK